MTISFHALPAPPHCLSHLTGNHLLHFYKIESNDITHKRFSIAGILLDKFCLKVVQKRGREETQISST